MLRPLRARLAEPVDAASLGAFRVVFGALMLAAVIRFWSKGWIGELYIDPAWHFPYEGFAWVRPWPGQGMYLHFLLMGLAAIGVMTGTLYRLSTIMFLGLFVWAELIDKSVYLNHYYLVSLLSALAVWLPLDATLSVDAWRDPGRAASTVPAWTLWLLRLQLGVVYFYAGVAKVGADWLHGQPLRTWLAARSDLALLGPWLAAPVTGVAMAWAGMLFDLCVPFMLLVPRWRAPAFLVLVIFHVITGWLFPIGMFPFVMVGCTLVFFDPSWPRRWLPAGWFGEGAHRSVSGLPLAVAWATFQVIWPLRSHVQTDDVLWTERGFRWSWRVLLVEKLGHVELRVVDHKTGESKVIKPETRLTPYQAKMMATQPDMILQFAHMLRDEARDEGREPSIFAESWVSFNGRPAARYVDPRVDLAAIDDGWGERWWVLPRPGEAP